MMMNEAMKKLHDEYGSMRARLEELRVKGSLGKMELRDKLDDFKSALEPAYQKAKSTLADLSCSGADESKAVAKSLVAGWDELRETHHELSEESDRERKKAHDAKRNSDC
jgi:hypothetical protein